LSKSAKVVALAVPAAGPAPAAKVLDVFAQLGIKRKRKWAVAGQLKRTNWKVIPVTRLTERAFWAGLDEERLASTQLIAGLQDRFGSKPSLLKQVSSSASDQQGAGRRCRELRFLDPKAAQNLSLILGGGLKHISYTVFRSCILRCDTSVLTESLLQTLVQYLPSPDQFIKLSKFKDEYDELPEPEKFVLSLSNIKRLVPRLKALMFKLHFPELVADCRPGVVSVTAACQEVMRSAKMSRVLELILLIGNIMNTGSRLEQSVGFDISYLPKLSNTKDRENKSTLLHFLVETIEAEQPDLLNFYEEILHLDKASKASFESIDKALKHMETSIHSLRTDLTIVQTEDIEDTFHESMSGFVEEAQEQFSILNVMRQKLDTIFSELAEFYVFDKQKYSVEEFLGDIKTFKDQFRAAHVNIREEREVRERAVRARAAREKSLRAKEERSSKKAALVESVLEDAESGVMDTLLEALKTGTAFSRDGRRKRNARLAGAERRAELSRTRSRCRMMTRSHSDVMDVLAEAAEERSASCVNIHHQPEGRAGAGGRLAVPGLGRERSYSDQVELMVTLAADSDTLMRQLRDL